MKKLKIALDWTPNINHIGFFTAKEKGFYQEQGIKLEIMDPSQDNYALTPAKKVEQGQVDFALCPTESLISYRTKKRPFLLKGIAGIFKEDMSAIVVKGDSGIQSPKDLDGKSYASYQARYEDEIVRQMIRNDGGEGHIKVDYPSKLGIWETILSGQYDSTWIFTNWEGVQAEAKEVNLRYFKMSDYDIPYSYSPVIAASEEAIEDKKGAYQSFLAATQRGYLYAQQNPEEAVALLAAHVPGYDQDIDLEQALRISSPHFGSAANWGRMELQAVAEFLGWIYEKGLESNKLNASDMVTNELLV